MVSAVEQIQSPLSGIIIIIIVVVVVVVVVIIIIIIIIIIMSMNKKYSSILLGQTEAFDYIFLFISTFFCSACPEQKVLRWDECRLQNNHFIFGVWGACEVKKRLLAFIQQIHSDWEFE